MSRRRQHAGREDSNGGQEGFEDVAQILGVHALGVDISLVWPFDRELVGYIVKIAHDLSALRIMISIFLETIVWAILGARSGSETVGLARKRRVYRR